MTNRLGKETSPYLLQHAENPVDWYPWGPEALERARREDRPILLSVGYAACHWCHVMERESFEDEAIAKLMNEHFVCIKVDREERPDVDEVYMAATVAMSGHGGWPMTVFLTPEQKPFFAGTYFPPTDQYGRPGFPSLLQRIAELWREQRDDLMSEAEALTERMAAQTRGGAPKNVLSDGMARAARTLVGQYDPPHGGFGGAPKFPPTAQLALLLREHRRTQDPALLEPVTGTLDGMMNGGIHDHLGGGFARYSTDDRWLVPHFEKMLYDNALLARVYLEAFQVTGNAAYARVARETLEYILREMQGPEGGYYSATDADSEGEEGKFFVWTPEAVDRVLDDDDAEAFSAYYDVTPQGNWEGVSVLNTPRPLEDVAKDLGITAEVLEERLARAREKLRAARSERVPPLLDDKVIVSWNGLMIGAMAEGARTLGERRYLDSARRAARFIRESLRRPDGRLLRTYRDGKAHLDACLEDYAYLTDALVDLYEASGERAFRDESAALADQMVQNFSDPEGGGFFHTAHDAESLVVRVREGHDGALPSPNAVAARALVRVGRHLDRSDLIEHGARVVRAFGGDLERMPRAFCSLLMAAELLFEPPVELVLAGPVDAADTQSLAAAAARHFLPNRVIVWPDGLDEAERERLPLTAGKRSADGRPALYVCRDFTCEAPVTEVDAVAGSLGDVSRSTLADRRATLSARLRPGLATPEGTGRLAARFADRPFHGPLGGTGLVVSRVGFGGYRIADGEPAHRAALERALGTGVNLVDTSPNYSDGRSELLVGSVVGALADQGKLARDELVVVTKVGYVAAGDAASGPRGDSEKATVTIGDGLRYCIHPDWVAEEIARSRSRLGLETLDVLLLHNPEALLKAAHDQATPIDMARAALYERIEAAFRHLESEVRAGRIARYGVSTNTAGARPDDPELIDVARLLEAAERAGGSPHHFQILQVPLNVFESDVATEGSPTAIEIAHRAGLGVLTNRPLNAIVAGNVVRLSDPPDVPEANLSAALERVKALEAAFERELSPMLRSSDGSPVTSKILDFARQLGEVAAQAEGYEAWRELERRMVAPGITRTLAMLDEAFRPSGVAAWPRFQAEYVAALKELTRGVAARAASRSRARAGRIRGILGPLMPASFDGALLAHQAIRTVASVPGVSSVLVGMRQEGYVADALEAARRPPVEDPLRVLRGARAAGLE